MEKFMIYSDFGPPESYSTQLDRQVSAQEMPYGYSSIPPMAGNENVESRRAAKDQDYAKRKKK